MVLGNESCDLDSAVSAIVYAFLLHSLQVSWCVPPLTGLPQHFLYSVELHTRIFRLMRPFLETVIQNESPYPRNGLLYLFCFLYSYSFLPALVLFIYLFIFHFYLFVFIYYICLLFPIIHWYLRYIHAYLKHIRGETEKKNYVPNIFLHISSPYNYLIIFVKLPHC